MPFNYCRRVDLDVGEIRIPCPFCQHTALVPTHPEDVTPCEYAPCGAQLMATLSVVALRTDPAPEKG